MTTIISLFQTAKRRKEKKPRSLYSTVGHATYTSHESRTAIPVEIAGSDGNTRWKRYSWHPDRRLLGCSCCCCSNEDSLPVCCRVLMVLTGWGILVNGETTFKRLRRPRGRWQRMEDFFFSHTVNVTAVISNYNINEGVVGLVWL